MGAPIDSSVKITRPFSSDTDKDKQELQLDADIYRDKLETQWNDLKVDATNYGKQALVIGGVVATTFVVMNSLLPKSKKDKALEKAREMEKAQLKLEKAQLNEPKVVIKKKPSQVGQAVQSLAWTLAVGWARQKLKHLIEDERKAE